MKALYLEKKGVLTIRDYEEEKKLTENDVEIDIKNVGICGSDVHYYEYGNISTYVVKKPMILGHEAAGIVKRVGSAVKNLKAGDKVCMEPGIPDFNSKSTLMGFYNLDPTLTFWATPPYHGCLRESVIHPASFTFKLPDNVSLEEGAMVEPLAIGMQSAMKAKIKPGDTALVCGSGTIGIMCAISAMAGGCSKVIISDVLDSKLDVAKTYDGLIPVNITKNKLKDVVNDLTGGWGADIVIEASGSEKVYPDIFNYCCPGGRFVMVGIPVSTVQVDIAAIQSKEVTVESVFRYCNVYARTLNLIAAGKIDVKKLIGKKYPFKDSIEAFEYVSKGGKGEVKVQIYF
jgi:D-xylulose reductase